MSGHQDEPFLTPGEWHAWYATQAGWTRQTRLWLYRQAGLGKARDVLEVGCGTGVIAEELARLSSARVFGLECDPARLAFARQQRGGVTYVQGDAYALPFRGDSFDLVVCHYLLLWLADPVQGMLEMARVARRPEVPPELVEGPAACTERSRSEGRPGGCLLACAEPDYGGRVDHPPELASLGRLQTDALRRQGAEPEMGRRLGEIFVVAGLQATVGTMAGRWDVSGSPDESGFEAEWRMRGHDLAGLVSPEELRRLRSIDRQALVDGRRTLFVPTFYALGRKVL